MSSSLPTHLPQHPSGIYGPGAYTAWLLTLLASWLSFFNKDYTTLLHAINAALYMNWAAIDLFRHFDRSQKEKDVYLSNLITPLAVLYIGILHTFAQILAHLIANTPPARRRVLVLLSTLVIPTLAVYTFTSSMDSSKIAWTESFLGAIFPTSSFSNIFVVFGVIALYGVSELVAMGCMAQFAEWEGYGIIHYAFWGVEWVVVFLGLGTWLVGRGYGVGEKKCWAMPCSSVGWGEWDQVFALGVAGLWFAYEFGLKAAVWVIRKVRTRDEKSGLE